MTLATVSPLASVVKSVGDDRSKREWHTPGVSTLLQRLEHIMETRGLGQREWARRAGLGSEKDLGVTLHRLRKNADAQVKHETLVKLAKGADVSLRWLATGEGTPDSTEASDDATPVYRNAPGWPEAAKLLRARGYPSYAIERAGTVRKLTSQPVTIESAVAAVQMVMAEIAPEEEAALAVAEVEAQYKGAETRAAKRMLKKSEGAANDSPPAPAPDAPKPAGRGRRGKP
jgi:hypothetical protein